MKQINFQLPTVRKLPIAVTYAVGLVCENRADLADEVRASVLRVSNVPGDLNSVGQLAKLSRECATFGDEQGAILCGHLSEIVHYGGNAPTALNGLAGTLGIILQDAVQIINQDGEEHFNQMTIGDVWVKADQSLVVCGLGGSWLADLPLLMSHLEQSRAHRGALVLQNYLRDGLEWVWGDTELDVDREALRRLIPIHAHTVSLDADVRAAWAKAHLDALNCPTE